MGAIRRAFREPTPFRFSDDMDDWYVRQGWPTYTDQESARSQERKREQERLRKELEDVGPAALPAARKALRMSGRWREIVLEHMARNGGSAEDGETLALVAVRARDPLASRAREVLSAWGKPVSGLVVRQRSEPTATQRAHERKLSFLVDLCQTPHTAREMMNELGLWDRRNFGRNYLNELVWGRKHLRRCSSGCPSQHHFETSEAGRAWLAEQP